MSLPRLQPRSAAAHRQKDQPSRELSVVVVHTPFTQRVDWLDVAVLVELEEAAPEMSLISSSVSSRATWRAKIRS
jgi:hypothetical protein